MLGRRVELRAAVAALLAFAGGCGKPAIPPALPPEPILNLREPDLFEDATAKSGVDFTYRNGEEVAPPHLSILESLGGGGAAIDYDGDGLLDLYLAGGGHFGGADNRQILGHPGRLYRNKGNFQFEDVTGPAGLASLAGGKPWFYSHGCAVADYDRDGWPDLLVTGWEIGRAHV